MSFKPVYELARNDVPDVQAAVIPGGCNPPAVRRISNGAQIEAFGFENGDLLTTLNAPELEPSIPTTEGYGFRIRRKRDSERIRCVQLHCSDFLPDSVSHTLRVWSG